MGSASNFFDSASIATLRSVSIGDIPDVTTTGVASGQVLKYNGGTSKWEPANDLQSGSALVKADYVPSIEDVTGNSGSAAIQTGRYAKNSTLVTVALRLTNIDTTGMSASERLKIGLPFTAASTGFVWTAPIIANSISGSSNSPVLIARAPSAANFLYVQRMVDGGAAEDVTIGDLSSGFSDINVSITYETTS